MLLPCNKPNTTVHSATVLQIVMHTDLYKETRRQERLCSVWIAISDLSFAGSVEGVGFSWFRGVENFQKLGFVFGNE